MEAKGIASVRSRVVNLQELAPALTISTLKAYMVQAFQTVYGLPASEVSLGESDHALIEAMARENKSWEFLFGTPLPFTFQCQERFDWGTVQLQLQAKGGIIHAAKVYSDAMDWSIAPAIETALNGCIFRPDDMKAALTAALRDSNAAKDLCRMLDKQEI